MARKDQASENENWNWLRDKAVAELMNLLAAQTDLEAQIKGQLNLIQLFDSLLKPPK